MIHWLSKSLQHVHAAGVNCWIPTFHDRPDFPAVLPPDQTGYQWAQSHCCCKKFLAEATSWGKCSYFSNGLNTMDFEGCCSNNRPDPLIHVKYAAFLKGSSFLPPSLPLNFMRNVGFRCKGLGFLSWLTRHRTLVTSGGGSSDILGGWRYDWLYRPEEKQGELEGEENWL